MKLRDYLFASHLDDGEKILYVAHRHALILKIASFKTFNLGIVAPTILFWLFPQGLFVYFFWWGAGLIGMLYHFIDWYFDAWLITNTGVIDIERHGLFTRNSTRIEYHMMEGIAYSINGFWQTVFNFGDIQIDKIGMNTSVILKDASHPKKVERTVMKCQEKYLSSKSVRDHNALKDMLSEMIAYHVNGGQIMDPTKKD